jgi:conjugal transfer pilin signal peptidase TrbI
VKAVVHAVDDEVQVRPGTWVGPEGSSPLEPPRAGLSARWRRFWAARGPRIQRTLPRDLALLLCAFLITRHLGLGFVLTDSVHTSLALVLPGTAARRGDLVAFAYTGQRIEDYYSEHWWHGLQRALGAPVRRAGPAPGDGFVKYLVGIEGDRLEVNGRQVVLVRPDGARLDLGVAKTQTKRGVALHVIAAQVIPPGFVYVWAPHLDALDSRYAEMGLVPAKALVGKAVRLW